MYFPAYIIFVIAVIVLIRFILGPTFADRMIALDLLGQIMVLLFVILAVINSSPMYLDIAITFVLLLFIGTVAVSKWVRRD